MLSSDISKINDVIEMLRDRQTYESNPVKQAQLGEAMWTLYELTKTDDPYA